MTPLQQECLGTIRRLIAADPRYAGGWLKPSFVMAHAEVESAWQPAIKAADFATTGSVGLMQVTVATLAMVGMAGKDQTVPSNSIEAGMRDIAWCRHALVQHFGAASSETAYCPYIVAGYNEGIGNVFKGYRDLAYVDRWRPVQAQWAFVDQETAT